VKLKNPISTLLPPEDDEVVEVVKSKKVSLEGVVGSKVNSANYTGNGHWYAEWLMGKPDKVGFVYIIRNKVTGRCYIGKKNYRGAGVKNRGEDSNWRWYITSSKGLSEDIKKLGKENFEFICLEEYKYSGALAWAETWTICFTEAPSNQDKWYNRDIGAVRWTVKEPISQRHKERLEVLVRLYHGKKCN